MRRAELPARETGRASGFEAGEHPGDPQREQHQADRLRPVGQRRLRGAEDAGRHTLLPGPGSAEAGPTARLEGRHLFAGNPDRRNGRAVKGQENLGEHSIRCYSCFLERLTKTAKYAADNQFSYFTTTLSISPYKNSSWLNEIGYKLEREYGIKYLYSDFKKEDGYKRSIALSKEYDLYRQDYCGCIYSLNERGLKE